VSTDPPKGEPSAPAEHTAPETCIIVEPAAQGERLDRFLAQRLADVTRSRIQKQIIDGAVQVDGRRVKTAYTIRAGETICYRPPPPVAAAPEPQPLDLNIVYEDSCLLVVDKPAGLVVHPAAGHRDGTLVNALLYHCKDLAGVGGVERPGIVHRLDKDTSGLLVVTKDDVCHARLAAQFKAHSIERRYLAVVSGHLPADPGTFDTGHRRHPRDRKRYTSRARPGRGVRRAVTHYRVLRALDGASLVEVKLETGRTHQVRVHFADAGHPLVGDPVYGRKPRKKAVWEAGKILGRQALHAAVLGVVHPRERRFLRWVAELPPDMQTLLHTLGGAWPPADWPPPLRGKRDVLWQYVRAVERRESEVHP
jgi:23S rRNA pseudouridine1911/1915/1917 synthase